jgi:hypothetical protein
VSFITSLLGDLWPYLAAAGIALTALWQYGRTQKKAGINEQKVKEAAAREQDIRNIKEAADAGARVRPDDDGMLDDPYNRDRRAKP